MANNDAEFRIGGDISDLKAAAEKAQAEIKRMSEQMQHSLANLNGMFQKIHGTFMAFTAAVAGGAAFKSVINASNEWALESAKLARTLDVPTEKASIMKVAMNRIGIESDLMVSASQKMSKQIFSNGEAFKTLGVQVRDSTGQYRPVVDVMGEVNQKLLEIKNPIEQNIAGQQVYGKSWGEVRAILKLTSEQMEWAAQRAKDLHLIVGPEGAEKAKKYKEQMRDLNLVGKSLEVQFGQQLTPVFVKLGAWMGEEAPAMGKVLKTVLESIAFVAQSVWLALKDMGDGLGALAAQANAILHGDLEGARAIGKMRDEESAKNEAAYEKLKANFGKPIETKVSKATNTSGPMYDFKDGKAAAQTRMSEWENQLEAQKLAYAKQNEAAGTFYEFSKQRERDYWAAIMGRGDLSREERLAAEKKYYAVSTEIRKKDFEAHVAKLKTELEAIHKNMQAKLAIAERISKDTEQRYGKESKQYHEAQLQIVKIKRDAADQQKKINEDLRQVERDSALYEVDVAQQNAGYAQSIGLITKAELIQQEMKFEQQRYQINKQALDDRLALMAKDPDMNPVEYQKLKGEILALERKHKLEMNSLGNKLQLEKDTPKLNIFSSFESSFSSSLTNMLTRAKTFKEAMSGLLKSMYTVFLQEMVTKPFAAWVAAKAKELAVHLGFLGAKNSTEAASSGTTVGIKATEATAVVGANAAEAASGAASSVASIPYVGWAMAAGVFAATMAMVMGASSSIKSARGGYDIPAGVNPVTQLHEEEMVLPKPYANVIRGMAAGSGSSGNSDHVAVGGDTHLHVHAVDSQSVERLFRDNGHLLAKELRRQSRNFSPTKA